MSNEHEPSLWNEKVGYLPLEVPPKVTPDTPLSDCIRTMQEAGQSCVLVFDGVSLCGMFTDRSMMRNFVATSMSGDTPVKEVMLASPPTLKFSTTIGEAITVYGKNLKIRYFPVFHEDGSLAGLLSLKILGEFLAESFPIEILNRPPKQGQISKNTEGA